MTKGNGSFFVSRSLIANSCAVFDSYIGYVKNFV